jgi:hypothetical protein
MIEMDFLVNRIEGGWKRKDIIDVMAHVLAWLPRDPVS